MPPSGDAGALGNRLDRTADRCIRVGFTSLPVHQQLGRVVDDAVCGRLNQEACKASELRGLFFAWETTGSTPQEGLSCPVDPATLEREGVPDPAGARTDKRFQGKPQGIFQPGHLPIRRVCQNASVEGLFSLTKTDPLQLRSRQQPIRQLHTATFARMASWRWGSR